ncbi:MAG TPA: MerC domain-containing protein, partial [Idiomarina baltica]|nr:MerC domain-containing protein [Idiomarina baltica]
MTHSKQQKLDRAGIWITTVCAIHCLLLPLILP